MNTDKMRNYLNQHQYFVRGDSTVYDDRTAQIQRELNREAYLQWEAQNHDNNIRLAIGKQEFDFQS